jgi:hypothetical protein
VRMTDIPRAPVMVFRSILPTRVKHHLAGFVTDDALCKEGKTCTWR